MNVGDIVKINDKTEWHGMYGIIDKIEGEIAFIYCVNRPEKLHPVPLGLLIKDDLKH
ncbi:MAG: hypothetical protein ACOZCL_10695 [Bacillota bacterium]